MSAAMLQMVANMAGIKPEDLQKLANNAQYFFANALKDLEEIKRTQAAILEIVSNDGHGGYIDLGAQFRIDDNGGVERAPPN